MLSVAIALMAAAPYPRVVSEEGADGELRIARGDELGDGFSGIDGGWQRGTGQKERDRHDDDASYSGPSSGPATQNSSLACAILCAIFERSVRIDPSSERIDPSSRCMYESLTFVRNNRWFVVRS